MNEDTIIKKIEVEDSFFAVITIRSGNVKLVLDIGAAVELHEKLGLSLENLRRRICQSNETKK